MKLMGILNVTPDSFSDGGRWPDPVVRGLALADEGAAILDVGGESTRPGSRGVDPTEERARVVPVIAALRAARPDLRISADTRRASVAAAAIDAGANLVNDVSGGADPEMFRVVARARVGLVLMHMRGTPDTMQSLARYGDVVAEVWAELAARETLARNAGIEDILVDPGIGFAKDTEQNLALLRDLPNQRHRRILLGASRKSFIGRLTGQDVPAERIEGSLAVALHAAEAGVEVLRVHDVVATRRALAVWSEIRP